MQRHEQPLMGERIKLDIPKAFGKILLHSCCAPCSGGVIESLCEAQADFTVYFYNPNIQPREEYQRRKDENKRFADKLRVPFVDADYDPDNWLARVKGLETEPERGKRCTQCFALRLERSALYAHENGIPLLTSCFGISRWKNMDQVNSCGHEAAARYPDVCYWDYNWRKAGGALRMIEIARRENFYRQKYCGCPFSAHGVKEKPAPESARHAGDVQNGTCGASFRLRFQFYRAIKRILSLVIQALTGVKHAAPQGRKGCTF